jgi:hypothetical protein
MMINYIRYTNCSPESGDIIKTEFFMLYKDADQRRQEINNLAKVNTDVFFDNDIHAIEYGSAVELVEALNELNVKEFKCIDYDEQRTEAMTH